MSRSFVRGSAALLALVCASTVGAAPFSDYLVQSPRLASPERGSVAGDLSHLGFAPGNLARGEYSLPMPIALPAQRGGPLAGLVPTYAPGNGQTEWGMGWRLDLAIRRSAIIGDIDLAGDEFVSPWGRLVKRSDGSYAPTGAAPTVSLHRINDGWQAITGDGSRFTFAASDSVANGYEWMLTRVDGIVGDETVLSYTRNASGKPFLSAVEWGGRGAIHQYRLELDYETIANPLDDYRAGVALTLDRRVHEARVQVRSPSGTFETGWTYNLAYTPSPRGAAFYLTGVTRRNRAGVAEPTQTYRYDFGDTTLSTAALHDVPALSTVLATTGGDTLQPNKSSELDFEDDALADFEIAKDQSLVHRQGGTFVVEPLPAAAGAIAQCRQPVSSFNTPRALTRMTGDTTELKVFRSITNAATSTTRVLVCDRRGVPELDQQLPGEWGLNATTRLVDLNHDQRPDLVRVFSRGYQVVENTSDATGYHFVVHPRGTLSDAFTPGSTWVQDMNGDGQADLVMRFSSSVSVWYGLGQFQFAPTARSLSFKSTIGTSILDLAQRQLTFVDVNHDGLMDVMTTRDRSVGVFINNGRQLQETIVPGLTGLTWDFGAPVVADVTGNGNVEVMFTQGTTAKAIDLNKPSTGLLISADDGKGTIARFDYMRSAPVAGIRQRTTVLASLTLESSGYDTVSYQYNYGAPVLHSVGKHLVGFSSVDKKSPFVTEHVELLSDDDVAGVPVLTETTDERTPGIVRYTRSQYEDVTLDGVRWLRPSLSEAGYRSTDGSVTLASTTRYNTYERGFCPTMVTKTSPDSTLVTTTTLATVTAIPDELHCLPASQNLFGNHTNSALDFHYMVGIDHNAIGQVTRVTQYNPLLMMQALVLQDVTYDSEYRERTVGAPGRGTTTADYNAFGRLVSITDAVGVVTRVDEVDPVSDGVRALSTLRPGANTTAFFRYDDRDRLAASWDDLTGSSEQSPLMSFAYQDATQSLPGRIDSWSLADANVSRHAVALVGADGEAMVAGPWVGDHFALGQASITSRNALTQHSSFVGTMTDSALAAMTSEDLRGFGAPLVETVTAGFGHAVQTSATQQQGVVGVTTTDLALGATELVTRTHEPGGFTAMTATDSAGRLVRKTDETGVTHSYAYDALGRLVAANTPDGAQTLTFDGFGRAAQVTRAGVGAMTYAYDATSGLMVRKQHLDRTGTVVDTSDTSYDSIGRVTNVAQSTCNESSNLTFDYDGKLGTDTASGQLGRLSRVRGTGWDRSTWYDALGRAYREKLTLAGWRNITSDTTFRPDASIASNTLTIADSAGTPLLTLTKETLLDELGRGAGLRVNGAVIYTVTYDAENRVARADFASGESITFDYDPVTHERTGYAVDAPSASGGVHWERDERGLIAAETYAHAATTRRRAYAYDGRGMLTTAEASTYGYTPSGLPDSINDEVGARSVHRVGDQLTVDGVPYGWDVAGRVTTKGPWTFTYGPDGQLAHATRIGREVEFIYDETSQRLLKRVDGVPTRANVAGGVLTADHFVELVTVGGVVAGVLDNGEFTALLTDPRGTPFADSDGTFNLASAYGARTTHLGISEAIDYTKLGWDPDLEVVRMGVRDYDPKLSQFWTPDPLFIENLEKCQSSPLECSLYAYVGGNPISFTDPDGRERDVRNEYQLWASLNPEAARRSAEAWKRTDDGFNPFTYPFQVAGYIALKSFEGFMCMGGCSELNGEKRIPTWRITLNLAMDFTGAKLLKGAGGFLDHPPSRFELMPHGEGGQTGTVWDSIHATQPLIDGTQVPRSFVLTTEGGAEAWVHGHATKHLEETARVMLNRNLSMDMVNLKMQQELRTLQAAVEGASASDFSYGTLIEVGGWELKFMPPRAAHDLPVLIHALHQVKK